MVDFVVRMQLSMQHVLIEKRENGRGKRTFLVTLSHINNARRRVSSPLVLLLSDLFDCRTYFHFPFQINKILPFKTTS